MKIVVTIFLVITTAHASESGAHHGSLSDLIFPTINFLILFSALVYFKKNSLKEMFAKNADEIRYLFEHADKKDKEAKIKLSALQKKMQNFEGEKNKISVNAEKEAEKFISHSKKESTQYLERLGQDMESKLIHERKAQMAKVKEKLVDQVISKAKERVATNDSLKEKVSKKIISQVK